MTRRLLPRVTFSCLAWLLGLHSTVSSPAAQAGSVVAQQKISETAGGFGGVLDPVDYFGSSLAALGDVDGDGITDLAVGAPNDDDGGQDQGAVWILFLAANGTVSGQTKIGEAMGGFGGVLEPDDRFGTSLAAIGDLDGNGVGDLAVGVPADHAGPTGQGAVWILFLDPDGTVAAGQKIGEGLGGFGGDLLEGDFFGRSLARLDDLDNDGVADLAVGAPGDDDGGGRQGAVWILFLNADGTVHAQQKISETSGGFGGDLHTFDSFGSSLGAIGDVDGNGSGDLAVGAIEDDDGVNTAGALWILFLNAEGTVAAEQKISALAGGFEGELHVGDQFGSSIAALGDLDGDGVVDLAVGAMNDDDGPLIQKGALWIVFLRTDGTVATELKIAEGEGGFAGAIDPRSRFGIAAAALGALGPDGTTGVAVGLQRDNDGGLNQGAVWILFLEAVTVTKTCFTLDFATEDDLATPLVNGQHLDVEFGERVTLASSGPNAGMAIFDSTPGGPNDPSQDLDLLVDSGNLLVLQTENLPPDANDIFPRPNDDEDGGTLSFAFPAPVEVRSLRLVDIDAGDGTSHVVLSDASGLQRTYTVPSNWTGDRMLAQPGHGTLDLATLAPQPGFASVATAAEDAGFDAEAVLRIDVVLVGSGAIDDVVWCAPGSAQVHASATVRNGTGVNPLALSNPATPVLGGTWAARLDCSGHSGGGYAHLLVHRQPGAAFTAFGELLVGGPSLLHLARPHLGSAAPFTASIPRDLSLLGLTASVQGLCTGGGVVLTNALDLVLGY